MGKQGKTGITMREFSPENEMRSVIIGESS
jgi:hypothetical protein